MPQAFLLQDWTTLAGAAGSDTVIQSKDKWLDLGGYADVVFYVEFREYSGTSFRIYYKTSASGDDGAWSTMDSETPSSTGLIQSIVRYSAASVPLARFVRWEIGASAAFTATFRVWCVARPG